MIRATTTDELLRSARRAAVTPNVRQAVRELTLHALRSRLLTAEHIACVVRTVGEGIESSHLATTVPVREAHGGAWAGLEDAVEEALHALELAAREFADGRAHLAPGEREAILDQVAQMETSLSQRWQHSRSVPASLKTRIGSVTTLLRQAATAEAPAAAAADDVRDAGRVLALVASGVLLGLSEALHGPVPRRSA